MVKQRWIRLPEELKLQTPYNEQPKLEIPLFPGVSILSYMEYVE